MANETVTITAEMKDEISAPLDNAKRKVDGFTDAVVKGSKRQSDAVDKSTAQLDKSVGKQNRLFGGMSSAVSRGTGGVSRLFAGMRSTVSRSLGGMSTEAANAGAKTGRAFGSGMNGALKTAVGAAAGIVGAGMFANLIGEAAKASDATDKFKATMNFAGIDASGIEAATKASKAYADQTVYDLPTIQNTFAQLASNGIKDYDGLTKAAGNLNAVAGGNAETFQSVSRTLTQTAGAGKLMTEDWNMLADAIPGASGPLQKAMKEAGAFEGNFREAMANGEISADEFNTALMKLGNDPIAVEAAKSTKTFEGALGNLNATINSKLMTALDAIKPAATGAINALAGGIGKAMDKTGWAAQGLYDLFVKGDFSGAFSKAFNVHEDSPVVDVLFRIREGALRLKETIAGFGIGEWVGVAGGAGLLLAAFGKFSPILAPVLGLFAKLGPLVGGLGGALKFLLGPIGLIAGLFIYAYSTSEPFRAAINSLLPVILSLASLFAAQLAPVFTMIATTLLPTLVSLFASLVPIFIQVLMAVLPVVVTLASQLLPVFMELIAAVLPILVSLLTTLAPIFMTLLQALLPIIPPAMEIVTVLLGLAMQVITPLIPLISTVAGVLAKVLGGAIEGIMPIVKFLIDRFVDLVTYLKGPLSEGINWVGGLFEGIAGIIADVSKNVGDFFSNPLGGLQDMLGVPKNSGGGVYSGGGVVGAFAGGGVLGGYAPGRDSILARLSPGESVLVPELTRAIGPQNIMAANAQASGGRPAGSGPSLTSGYSAARTGAAGGSVTTINAPVTINVNAPNGVTEVELSQIRAAVEEIFATENRRSY